MRSFFSKQLTLEGIRTYTSIQQLQPTNNSQLQTIEATFVSMKIGCIWAIGEKGGGSEQKEGETPYAGRRGDRLWKWWCVSGGYGLESDMCFAADVDRI